MSDVFGPESSSPALGSEPAGNYAPAVGSDPHGRYGDQVADYADLIEAARTPTRKYQAPDMSQNDGGAETGGNPGGVGGYPSTIGTL